MQMQVMFTSTSDWGNGMTSWTSETADLLAFSIQFYSNPFDLYSAFTMNIVTMLI